MVNNKKISDKRNLYKNALTLVVLAIIITIGVNAVENDMSFNLIDVDSEKALFIADIYSVSDLMQEGFYTLSVSNSSVIYKCSFDKKLVFVSCNESLFEIGYLNETGYGYGIDNNKFKVIFNCNNCMGEYMAKLEFNNSNNIIESMIVDFVFADELLYVLEDFEENAYDISGSSYDIGSYVDYFGINWSYYDVKKTYSQAINGTSLILRSYDTGSYIKFNVQNYTFLNSMSVSIIKAYSTAGSRIVGIYADNLLLNKSIELSDFGDTYELRINEIDLNNVSYIRIASIGIKQIVIDDIMFSIK